jgi:hypothetical protein
MNETDAGRPSASQFGLPGTGQNGKDSQLVEELAKRARELPKIIQTEFEQNPVRSWAILAGIVVLLLPPLRRNVLPTVARVGLELGAAVAMRELSARRTSTIEKQHN